MLKQIKEKWDKNNKMLRCYFANTSQKYYCTYNEFLRPIVQFILNENKDIPYNVGYTGELNIKTQYNRKYFIIPDRTCCVGINDSLTTYINNNENVLFKIQTLEKDLCLPTKEQVKEYMKLSYLLLDKLEYAKDSSVNKTQGKFIVFEAIDGSGTSTQARMLYEYLSNEGYKVMLTEEPSDGAVGNLIKLAFKKRLELCGNKEQDDRQLALLFTADRHDHLYNKVNGIMNKIKEGWIVICTRYVMSSLVYNCNDKRDYNYVCQLNSEFPLPDLTFFIDCPVEVCLERLNKRSTKDTYENKEKLTEVKEKYDALMQNYEGILCQIDGKGSIEEQHNEITRITEMYL